MSIEKALGKLRAAQMCHPNAVQALIDEAIAAIQQAEAQQPATGEPVVWNSIQIASWIGSQLMHEPSMFERATVCKFVRSLGRHPTLLKHSPKIHPAPSVPDGYVLVPVEPTPEMEKAFRQAFTDQLHKRRNQWGRAKHTMSAEAAGLRAMLAAATSLQQPKEPS